eukprot:TRINITY_DN854_c0_g1_i1.p1 TRINITY_DN854_c0_g1~~TRINITY_DN854_c0_g1_i1.p1  ORF type:complete len:364 (-),score=51.09 TRINITY_DN854_c0_g1_i1:34-1125(-)
MPSPKQIFLFFLLFCVYAYQAKEITVSRQEALEAFNSYITKFWSSQYQWFEDTYPSNGVLTSYWVAAEGFQTLVDSISLLGDRTYFSLISQFYNTQNRNGWFRNWYDDEAWMASALISAYELTNDLTYLRTAELIFKDIQTAWDTTCCGTRRGGLWWDKSHTQKATASNAGGAVVCAKLARVTRNNSSLPWCEMVYKFWAENMVSSTGQVCDHMDTNGQQVWWKYTYNEALMIGAGLELYGITGDAYYISKVKQIANFMINSEVVQVPNVGKILYDGTDASCTGDCTQFKGPAYQYLSLLYKKFPDPAYLAVLQASANGVWNIARDPSLNVFGVDWSQPYHPSRTTQSQQNAAVTALVHSVSL